MPSLFTNRWGLTRPTTDQVPTDQQHVFEVKQPRAEKKTKKKGKKKKREGDENNDEETLDVDAAVINLVANELQTPHEDPKKRKFDNDIMLGLNNGYSNAEQHWESYINEEPHEDEYVVKESSANDASTSVAAPSTASATSSTATYRPTKKKQKVSKDHNVDPALEELDRHRERGPNQDFLLTQAIREASEISRSLQSDRYDSVEAQSTPTPDVAKETGSKKKQSLEKSRSKNAKSDTALATVAKKEKKEEDGDRRISWTGDGSETGGSFTEKEKYDLDEFMASYMKQHNLNEDQLRKRVWASERKKDNFWDQVSQVLPNRTRASVYKHVRRTYHVFHVRGKWTSEEDQELDKLYKEKGAQWKQIGQEMGRMPEDCRDRWRNYVKCGTNRKQNKWSKEEEAKLRQIVSGMMTDDPNCEVNWTAVSDKMDGSRSRIQCRYKWNKLCKKAAPVRIDAMLPGDHMAMIAYLKNSGVSNEADVDWAQLAQLEGKGIWGGQDFKDAFAKLKAQQTEVDPMVRDTDEKSFLEYVDALFKELNKLPESRRNARFKHNGSVLETSPSSQTASSNEANEDATLVNKNGYGSWKLK